jgi:hypothetical protein
VLQRDLVDLGQVIFVKEDHGAGRLFVQLEDHLHAVALERLGDRLPPPVC